ncbi:hypothetical protein KAR91_29505 [Candidatus Pacearchaeota archaeon]|nr:hypothetical protein [Candidatus Pacearchaeota archaeon]
MTDVQIQIGTQGEVGGLSKIKDEYTLLGKAKQAYFNIKEKPQAVGERMSADRKIVELERKAGDIDRRMMAAKLGMAEGRIAPEEGKATLKKLEIESLRANYERSFAREQQQVIKQREQSRARMFAPVVGAGRFAAGRTLKYGAMGAGMLGAYSLISSIMGETGAVDERNLAYATALSAARGRGTGGIDYATDKPFFELQEMLDELGQTAFMTSKEMVPLLDVAKELANFSKEAAKPLADVANIGKSLGVATPAIAEFFKGALQRGNIEVTETGELKRSDVEMSKMMMLNQNMMHRASESLQSMQQVMAATTHGVTGLGGFGIFNLLDTLNASQNRAYRGFGGAQAALRIDQAFRGGGADDAFQYMQTLALNPAFQATNRRRLEATRGVVAGEANWESGYYDQLIADLSKSLGAYSTPKDLIKTMKGMGVTGGEGYITKMFGGDGGMKKMNIQRLYDVFSTAYGAEQNIGNKFMMQMKMAQSMGVSPADIGVFGEAIRSPEFMKRAEAGKLRTGEYAAAYKAYEEEGQEGYQKWFQTRSENQETMISVASSIRDSIDEIKVVANEYLKPMAEAVREYLPEMVKSFVNWFGTEEQKKAFAIKERRKEAEELGRIGIDPGAPLQYMTKVPGPFGPGTDIEIPYTAKDKTIFDVIPDFGFTDMSFIDKLNYSGKPFKSNDPYIGAFIEKFNEIKEALISIGSKTTSAMEENTKAVKENQPITTANPKEILF